MKNHVSIKSVCEELGVSLSTVYRWLKLGKLNESFRTIGNHRRFNIEDIKEKFFPNYKKIENISNDELKVVTYSRVSSHDQAKDLITQGEKLKIYCKQHNYNNTEHISDLGSGLNYKKPGLKKLFKLILNKKINILIINRKDRLLRFGSEIIFDLCSFFNIKVIILEEEAKNFEEDLVSNVIELMTVFCAKMHGKRSHKNKNKIKQNKLIEKQHNLEDLLIT